MLNSTSNVSSTSQLCVLVYQKQSQETESLGCKMWKTLKQHYYFCNTLLFYLALDQQHAVAAEWCSGG